MLTTEVVEWFLELQLDDFGQESYWQISNQAGEIIAFGGNEEVGINGGGSGQASIDQMGAYLPGTLVTESITIPDFDDCYTFSLVDAFGDGLSGGGDAFLKLKDENGLPFLDVNLDSTAFERLDYTYKINAITSVSNNHGIAELELSPNPSSEVLNIKFDLKEPSFLNLIVYDLLGQQVEVINKSLFNSGTHHIRAQLDNLENGMYLLELSNKTASLSKTFTVIR